MHNLRLILPLFLLLARVIEPPRFLQLVGAAVPLFAQAFVGLLVLLPIPPLVIALAAAVRHAAPCLSSAPRTSHAKLKTSSSSWTFPSPRCRRASSSESNASTSSFRRRSSSRSSSSTLSFGKNLKRSPAKLNETPRRVSCSMSPHAAPRLPAWVGSGEAHSSHSQWSGWCLQFILRPTLRRCPLG